MATPSTPSMARMRVSRVQLTREETERKAEAMLTEYDKVSSPAPRPHPPPRRQRGTSVDVKWGSRPKGLPAEPEAVSRSAETTSHPACFTHCPAAPRAARIVPVRPLYLGSALVLLCCRDSTRGCRGARLTPAWALSPAAGPYAAHTEEGS